jgi:TonB-linked SusC/RagA family outer membrane protein
MNYTTPRAGVSGYFTYKKFSIAGSTCKKVLSVMKLTVLLTIITCFQIQASVYSQKVTLTVKDAPLQEVITEIGKQSGYAFFYDAEYLKNAQPVTLKIKDEPLSSTLNKVFATQPFMWDVTDNLITITPKKSLQPAKPAGYFADVKGKVTSATGETLPGATVKVKGTTKTAVTNIKGEFELKGVDGDAVLIVSYTGYVTQEIPLNNQRNITITLQEDQQSLNEVAVVAYGVQKKISLVGAQSSVSIKDLKQPVRSLANSLAGRVAGVISVQRTGEPGNDDAAIWIRGISTFDNSLSSPLILVDGVPRSFSNVDPEDIESFTVLKDASATAVYGVRGANGVIIINTKKGNNSKPKINFKYNQGLTAFTKLPKFADGVTYLQASNEALVTRGGVAKYSQAVIDATANGTDPELYPNVNWSDVLFKKTGYMRKSNMNINGGSEATQYYVGASYYDESGLYKTDALQKYDSQVGDKRYNLTTNLSVKATKTTKIDLGVQGYLENGNYPGTTQGTIFGNSFFVTPTLLPVRYNDGKIADNTTSSITNPWALLTQTGYSTRFNTQLYSNLRITQELGFWVKGLSVTGMFAFDAQNIVNSLRSKTPATYLATGRDVNGNLIYQPKYVPTGTTGDFLSYVPTTEAQRSIYNEAALNYNNTFGKHTVTALLLYNQSDRVDATVSKASPDVTTSFINALPFRFRGVAGRATYGFMDRYFAEANFGYNGAENLNPGNRYGFFPSGGLGWVLSEEPFFKPLKGIVQLLKIRATYGIVGNSNITGRRFAYSATVSNTTGYNFGKSFERALNGLDISQYASDVTWETAKKSDLGFDISLLNSDLNFQVDLFKERRDKIFLNRASLPAYFGLLNNPLGNVGIIDNHGIDGSLNYTAHLKNWSLRLQGNFTYNRNKVIEDDKPAPAYPWLATKGRKVGQQFGYVALGLFQSDAEVAASPKEVGDVRAGDLKYADLNNDGKIDAYDKTAIGHGNIPEIVYGFGFTLSHKAVSLSALFQGVGNVDIYVNGEGLVPFQQGLTRGNLFNNIDNRWSEANPNPNAYYPRLTAGTLNDNYAASTWWIQSGRYLRLKNIQLDVTLPKSFVNKIGIASASVFLQGVNVLTFTPFKLWDVELGNGRGATYPNVSTYSAGIDISFK